MHWQTKHGTRAIEKYLSYYIEKTYGIQTSFQIAELGDTFHHDLRGTILLNQHDPKTLNDQVFDLIEKRGDEIGCNLTHAFQYHQAISGIKPKSVLSLPQVETGYGRGTEIEHTLNIPPKSFKVEEIE